MLARALDIIFPPQCLSCEALVPSHGALCLNCWQGIRFIAEPMCHACGLPFEYAIGDKALCGECLQELPPYNQARAVFVYDEHSKALVLGLKFHDQLHLAATYGPWLAKTGAEMLPGCDIVVPVPLSWRRFVGRRYNQAALLAQAVSQKTGLTVIPDALIRKKHIPPQTGLSRAQRKDNVRGAFAANPKRKAAIKGKTVLLVDDVMTTGATLSACARALLKNGARAVNILTLARTAG